MVELQIVVLAVAGSSPVGHPFPSNGTRIRGAAFDHLARLHRRVEVDFREARQQRDNPVGRELSPSAAVSFAAWQEWTRKPTERLEQMP